MDTKKLYINSQKTILTWGLVIASLLLLTTLVSFFSKNSTMSSYTLWISSIVSVSIFSALFINRIYLNKNAALTAFLLYLAFTVYSIIEMMVKFKSTYSLLQTLSHKQNPILSISIAYSIGLIILFAVNFLYYKVYRATRNILILNSTESEQN